MKISIIIPCLNEQAHIKQTLKPLQAMRQRGHQIILCDAHSDDKTQTLARPWVDNLITSPAGRAQQMNAAAKLAEHDVLWFLHADTLVPDNADELILDCFINEHIWGRFNVRLSSHKFRFRIIETFINLRSCLSGIATGDQGIFVNKNIFQQLNGYQNIPLMEDIHLSKRLKKISRPSCISTTIITSSRRWEEHGTTKTIILMWRLRLAYFLGVQPEKLAQAYRAK